MSRLRGLGHIHLFVGVRVCDMCMYTSWCRTCPNQKRYLHWFCVVRISEFYGKIVFLRGYLGLCSDIYICIYMYIYIYIYTFVSILGFGFRVKGLGISKYPGNKAMF